MWTVPWNPRWICLYSIWNPVESKVDMPVFHMESSGIHVELMWNPCGINHSILIPHGIHDVHGIRNWLGSQPTFIPWIPYGIHDGFHGFHMDSIRNNPGKVKTSCSVMFITTEIGYFSIREREQLGVVSSSASITFKQVTYSLV